MASAATQHQIENVVGFCDDCMAQTTAETPGNIHSVNGIGTMLSASRWYAKEADRCPKCGSVVQIKWISFGVGLKPLGTYRVLYVKKGIAGFTSSRFFGRRLINDPYHFAGLQHPGSGPNVRPADPPPIPTGQSPTVHDATPAVNPALFASFAARVAAFLLDTFFTAVLASPVLALIELADRSSGAPPSLQSSSFLGLLFLAQLFYFAGLESSARQATWGKRLLHIKVCDNQYRRISFGKAVGRFFAKFLSGLLYGIGFLVALFTKQHQALHDLICATLVVNA